MICELQAKQGALARQGQTTRTRVRSRPAPTDGQAETKSRCPKSAKARCGPTVGGSHTRTQTRTDYKRYAAQGTARSPNASEGRTSPALTGWSAAPRARTGPPRRASRSSPRTCAVALRGRRRHATCRGLRWTMQACNMRMPQPLQCGTHWKQHGAAQRLLRAWRWRGRGGACAVPCAGGVGVGDRGWWERGYGADTLTQ
jgi:hypothetical protein